MADNVGGLIETIELTAKKAHVKSLDISFNELMDMVESDELDIDPDYQRLFRWSDAQQSRFIESLILEMRRTRAGSPAPPRLSPPFREVTICAS
jgi:hypothetical protein